jgi:hypothetical protein
VIETINFCMLRAARQDVRHARRLAAAEPPYLGDKPRDRIAGIGNELDHGVKVDVR